LRNFCLRLETTITPASCAVLRHNYGDQTLVLLESLDACDGNFVMEDFAQTMGLVLA
jgi:hypothetical protein